MTGSIRLKWLLTESDLRAGAEGESLPLLSVSISRGVRRRHDSDATTRAASQDLSLYKVCRVGELVINRMRAFQGALGIALEDGVVSPDYAVLRVDPKVDKRWLNYYLGSGLTVSTMASMVRGIGGTEAGNVRTPRLNVSDLQSMTAPRTSPEEQRAIADYLDRETARIDTLIEEQQRLIHMLRERRRVLVTRAVCFGVDDGADLRDSGDPVVGLVPTHWTVKAVRWWLESLDGKRVPLSAEERGGRRGDFAYYGASGVIDHVDDYLFDEPLVLVSEDGANLLLRSTPIAFAAKGRYWVNNHAHVLRPRGSGDVDFWAQRLEALDVTTVVSGSAQPKLTAGALMRLLVSAPEDVAEQQRISAYLDEQTAKIDTLIADTQRFIELSKERRSALITAAVTGQIDVRTVA
jgi:type I restriction enzyme S subunit